MSPMGKGSVGTALENRSNYGSSIPIPNSPKFNNDYVSSSSRGYGQKVDQLYLDRMSEYPSIERRQYAERHSAYLGTDLPSETLSRYVDPVSFGNEHQVLFCAFYFFFCMFTQIRKLCFLVEWSYVIVCFSYPFNFILHRYLRFFF